MSKIESHCPYHTIVQGIINHFCNQLTIDIHIDSMPLRYNGQQVSLVQSHLDHRTKALRKRLG